MKKIYADILVVGAGPTGLVLANLLGSHGINTILIEKNSATGVEPRAVSIDDESLRTLQAIGVIEKFLPMISKNYGSYYLTPKGKIFALIEPKERKYGYYKRNGFDQPQLEKLLYESLKKYDCVKVLLSSFLNKINYEEQLNLSYISTNNNSLIIKSKYIVACDGGTSGIRKLLGISLSGLSFNERWLIIDLFESDNKFRHTQVYCDSRRPCITLPGPRGIRRYEFKLRNNECKDGVCDEKFIRKLFHDNGNEINFKIRRKCVYNFHALVAEKWRHGSIFLAGDAAHLSPPFAGQGMNSGIRDAHNLAWKLAHAVKFDNSYILNSYETERKSHVWQMIKISILMGKILAPKNPFFSLITRFLFLILSLYGPARNYITQMRFKPEPYFKKGLLWHQQYKKGLNIIGRLFPQPLVEDIEGKQFLLDGLFNNENVILIFSENPQKHIKTALIKGFKKRNIITIGLTPEWINPVKAEFMIVREVTKLLSSKSYIRYLDMAFFIRPDRYVASIIETKSMDSFFKIANIFQNKA